MPSKLSRCAPLLVVLAVLGWAWPAWLSEGGRGRPVAQRTHRRARLQRISRRAETVSIPRSEKLRALQVLGLDATEPAMAQVKRAFRRKVARLHPDLKGGSESAEFREVLDAYALLTGRRRASTSAEADPFTGFDLRRSTRGKTEAEREAEFQRPGNWRWDQNAGYNPGDLEEVWAEIGYNPYTGEYRELPERDIKETDWMPEPEPARTSTPRRSKTQPRRSSRFGIARASDIPEPLPLAQIFGYLLLVAVSLFFALAPEQLLPAEERAKRLEELEEKERVRLEQQEERAALEILWRQRLQKWQREEMQVLSEFEPVDELAMLDSATGETGSLFAPDNQKS
eukprot:s2113_g7.t1